MLLKLVFPPTLHRTYPYRLAHCNATPMITTACKGTWHKNAMRCDYLCFFENPKQCMYLFMLNHIASFILGLTYSLSGGKLEMSKFKWRKERYWTHQPLKLEGEESTEHKDDPEDWTHNQTQPEDLWFRVGWNFSTGCLQRELGKLSTCLQKS